MPFTEAVAVVEIPPGNLKSVTLSGQKVMLANAGGTIYATSQKCPHLGANLCKGKLTGTVLKCPWHGASFDLTDGRPTGPANMILFKMNTKGLTTYPVKIEGGQVLIEI